MHIVLVDRVTLYRQSVSPIHSTHGNTVQNTRTQRRLSDVMSAPARH